MAEKPNKTVRIHNKSDKPDNIVEKENEIFQECEDIEAQMPRFLRSFFVYLKGNVLPMTRLAYLHDIRFFFTYLIEFYEICEKEPDIMKISQSGHRQDIALQIYEKTAQKPGHLCFNVFTFLKYLVLLFYDIIGFVTLIMDPYGFIRFFSHISMSPKHSSSFS